MPNSNSAQTELPDTVQGHYTSKGPVHKPGKLPVPSPRKSVSRCSNTLSGSEDNETSVLDTENEKVINGETFLPNEQVINNEILEHKPMRSGEQSQDNTTGNRKSMPNCNVISEGTGSQELRDRLAHKQTDKSRENIPMVRTQDYLQDIPGASEDSEPEILSTPTTSVSTSSRLSSGSGSKSRRNRLARIQEESEQYDDHNDSPVDRVGSAAGRSDEDMDEQPNVDNATGGQSVQRQITTAVPPLKPSRTYTCIPRFSQYQAEPLYAEIYPPDDQSDEQSKRSTTDSGRSTLGYHVTSKDTEGQELRSTQGQQHTSTTGKNPESAGCDVVYNEPWDSDETCNEFMLLARNRPQGTPRNNTSKIPTTPFPSSSRSSQLSSVAGSSTSMPGSVRTFHPKNSTSKIPTTPLLSSSRSSQLTSGSGSSTSIAGFVGTLYPQNSTPKIPTTPLPSSSRSSQLSSGSGSSTSIAGFVGTLHPIAHSTPRANNGSKVVGKMELTNRLKSKIGRVIQKKRVVIGLSAMFSMAVAIGIMYIYDREIISLDNPIPVIVLAVILVLIVAWYGTKYGTKQYNDTIEYTHKKDKSDCGVNNYVFFDICRQNCLNETIREAVIKSIILKYDNGTLLEFCLNGITCGTHGEINSKVCKRSDFINTVGSVINNRPIYVLAPLTSIIVTNSAVLYALYRLHPNRDDIIPYLGYVRDFYLNSNVGSTLLTFSCFTAVIMIYFSVYYYNKTGCDTVTIPLNTADKYKINSKYMEVVEEKIMDSLCKCHDHGEALSLELSQVVVECYNGPTSIYIV